MKLADNYPGKMLQFGKRTTMPVAYSEVRERDKYMCMNAAGDGHREIGGPSGMRPAGGGISGMQCQGLVSGTQAARQAALTQSNPPTPKKAFRPLLCVGNYSLR